MFAYELASGQKFKVPIMTGETVYTCVAGADRHDFFKQYPGVVGAKSSGIQMGFGEMHEVVIVDAQIGSVEFVGTDSGLGIGGIRNDQSMPIIPSARAFARVQRLSDTDTVCRRCGASKHFDGAMFTTITGSGICDDCI
tara:strand:+ start:99 stop:515 length:417 start_codon:yes stop_codon:yes gene_type:complete